MARLLPLALLVFVPAAFGADPSGTESVATEDCSVNEDGNGSQDCVWEFRARFYRLARVAGIPHAQHAHFGEYPGVALHCEGDKVKGKPDLIPIGSIACGENLVAASGSSLFSLARSCEIDGVKTPLLDSLAAIAAHELAHLAHGHTQEKMEIDGRVCAKWAKAYFDSPEGRKFIDDESAELARMDFLTEAQKQAEFNTRATRLCHEKAAKELADEWRPFEAFADKEAQLYLRTFGGQELEAAYACAMKGVQDFEWAESARMPEYREHPKAAERVRQARLLRFKGLGEAFCKSHPDNILCNALTKKKKK